MRMDENDKWVEESSKRCIDFKEALKTGNINSVYDVLRKYFDSGYQSIIPNYIAHDTAFVFAEEGTIGLSELMDEPNPDAAIYELSHELSCALFNWNDWGSNLDDYLWNNTRGLYFDNLKNERAIFDEVQIQLAIEVKRQAPDCRVILPIPKLEIIKNDGVLQTIEISDDKIPARCEIMPDFIYEFDREIENADGRKISLYKTIDPSSLHNS